MLSLFLKSSHAKIIYFKLKIELNTGIITWIGKAIFAITLFVSMKKLIDFDKGSCSSRSTVTVYWERMHTFYFAIS